MAIIDTILPEKVSQVKCNEVRVAASSNMIVEPLVNNLRIRVDGSPSVGEELTFSYDGVTVTFTVAAQADDSGSQLSQQGALSLDDYVALLADELKKNWDVCLNFRVEFDVSAALKYIRLFPRATSSLDWTFENGLTNFDVVDVVSSSSADVENGSIALLVEVYDQESAEYGNPLPHILPILINYQPVVFDIRPDFNLRYHLPDRATIGIGGDFFNHAPDCYTKYRLRLGERQGAPPQVQALNIIDQEFFAIYGGRPTRESYQKWWQFFGKGKQFLTLQPLQKETTMEQPEWLYWIGRADHTLLLRVETTAYDGTETTYTLSDGYDFELGVVAYIKTGFTQLGLTYDPANPIIAYTVYLVDGADFIWSEKREYILDADCVKWERYFLFGNSLGGCDTLRATGKSEATINYEAQQAERILSQEVIENGRGQYFQYNRSQRVSFEARVGYISKEQLLYLHELLLSEEAWMIDVDTEEFIPIVISPGSVDFFKDGQDLYTLTFNYEYAFEDCAISNTEI